MKGASRPARTGRNTFLALVVVVVIVGAGFGYEYVTLSSKVSDLNQTVSSQGKQISSLNSMVPDSEIFAVHYTLTLFFHTGVGLNATVFHVDQGLGLLYHSGQQATLLIEADQLVDFTGSMNFTNIRTDQSQGFGVSSISPSLPLTVHSGGVYGESRILLTVVLNTPSTTYRGDLWVYIQAYSS
jgi:hypothetical protein